MKLPLNTSHTYECAKMLICFSVKIDFVITYKIGSARVRRRFNCSSVRPTIQMRPVGLIEAPLINGYLAFSMVNGDRTAKIVEIK